MSKLIVLTVVAIGVLACLITLSTAAKWKPRPNAEKGNHTHGNMSHGHHGHHGNMSAGHHGNHSGWNHSGGNGKVKPPKPERPKINASQLADMIENAAKKLTDAKTSTEFIDEFKNHNGTLGPMAGQKGQRGGGSNQQQNMMPYFMSMMGGGGGGAAGGGRQDAAGGGGGGNMAAMYAMMAQQNNQGSG